jgi:hypothetical protein
MIQTEVDGLMAAIQGTSKIKFQGVHPLLQKNPAYYIQFCNAIGQGLINGGPVIEFTTNDTGLSASPLIPGTGLGIGIFIDKDFFRENAYTNARNAIIERFQRTYNDPYPPGPDNTGQFLDAICNGVATSVHDYYTTAWTLNSVHPQIYQGTGLITDGQFSGISSGAIASSIQSYLSGFQGEFYPELIQAIADAYVLTITTMATGTVTITGTCVPSISQVCAIPSTGHGTGVAS